MRDFFPNKKTVSQKNHEFEVQMRMIQRNEDICSFHGEMFRGVYHCGAYGPVTAPSQARREQALLKIWRLIRRQTAT